MLSINFTALVLTGCMDQEIQRTPQPIGGKTIGHVDDRPGGFQQNPGESYPNPEIFYQEFVPPEPSLSEWRCHTWRITWPMYDSDFDQELIPTIFSIGSGNLNSLNFINNQSPHVTFKTTMSLHINRKIYSSSDMMLFLDYEDFPFEWENEDTYFKMGNVSLNDLTEWVQERPLAFKYNWPAPEARGDTRMEYQEGDFIHFRMATPDHYGGIRIVSDSPRIIEVYLAIKDE